MEQLRLSRTKDLRSLEYFDLGECSTERLFFRDHPLHSIWRGDRSNEFAPSQFKLCISAEKISNLLRALVPIASTFYREVCISDNEHILKFLFLENCNLLTLPN